MYPDHFEPDLVSTSEGMHDVEDILPPLMGGIYFPKSEKYPNYIRIDMVPQSSQITGGKKMSKSI